MCNQTRSPAAKIHGTIGDHLTWELVRN